MNRQQFIEYIKSPEKLNAASVIQLEKLIQEYPYCQTADVLFTINLYKENHFKFNDQLKLVSAYACDRKLLKGLINTIRTLDQSDATASKTPSDYLSKPREHASTELSNTNLDSLVNLLKDEVQIIKSRPSKKISTAEHNKLNKLADQLEVLLSDLDDPKPIEPKTQQSALTILSEYNMDHLEDLVVDDKNQLPENDLIDKFLENEPQIDNEVKSTFFDPLDNARKSLIDNESVVSETLAEIYYKQGNLSKAIKIYKKLSLFNPEKSTFFAAQIEKIRKEIK
jgi:hypothetical protein